MTGAIPDRVTCRRCDTDFDPGESRGWCPDAACGEWRHPAFPPSPGGRRLLTDGGVDAPTKTCPGCGKDVRADANFCKFCSHEFPDEPDEPDDRGEPEESQSGLDECPDCGADVSAVPPDRLGDCPICGTDLRAVLADRAEPAVTPADLSDCPACGEDLTTIPADMRMVCPGCRVGLQEAIETHGVESEADATGGRTATTDEAVADVETVTGIGTSYAGRLAEAGVETVGDLVAADARALSAATDVPEKRIEEWIENAPVDPADVPDAPPEPDDDPGPTAGDGTRDDASQEGQTPGGQGGRRTVSERTAGGQSADRERPAGGQDGRASDGRRSATGTAGGDRHERRSDRDGDRNRSGRGAGPSHDTVVLEVLGREIRARPGETLGREIRTAMVEGTAPDDDAAYVHREHVRVEREGDTFYFVRLGQNSLHINGQQVGDHERVEVSSGDTASFSEVVTAEIRLE